MYGYLLILSCNSQINNGKVALMITDVHNTILAVLLMIQDFDIVNKNAEFLNIVGAIVEAKLTPFLCCMSSHAMLIGCTFALFQCIAV